MQVPNTTTFFSKSDKLNKILVSKYGDLIPDGFTSDDYVKKLIIEKAVMTKLLERKNITIQQLREKSTFYKLLGIFGTSEIDHGNKFIQTLFQQDDWQNQQQSKESIQKKVLRLCQAIELFVLHNLVLTHFPEYSKIRKEYQSVKSHIPNITKFSKYQTFNQKIKIGSWGSMENFNSICRLWYFNKLKETLNITKTDFPADIIEKFDTHELWIGTRDSSLHETTRGWYNSSQGFIAAFADQYDENPGVTLLCFPNLNVSYQNVKQLLKDGTMTRKSFIKGFSNTEKNPVTVIHIKLNKQVNNTCQYHGIENIFRLYCIFREMGGLCSNKKAALRGSSQVDKAIEKILTDIMKRQIQGVKSPSYTKSKDKIIAYFNTIKDDDDKKSNIIRRNKLLSLVENKNESTLADILIDLYKKKTPLRNNSKFKQFMIRYLSKQENQKIKDFENKKLFKSFWLLYLLEAWDLLIHYGGNKEKKYENKWISNFHMEKKPSSKNFQEAYKQRIQIQKMKTKDVAKYNKQKMETKYGSEEYRKQMKALYKKKDFHLILDEIKKGKKDSHWMWWGFPVFYGCWGNKTVSDWTKLFAFKDQDEAKWFVDEFNQYYKEALQELSTWDLEKIKKFFSPIDFPKFKCHIDFFYENKNYITLDDNIRKNLEKIYHQIIQRS